MKSLFNRPEYFYQSILLTITTLVTISVGVSALITVEKNSSDRVTKSNDVENQSMANLIGGEISSDFLGDEQYEIYLNLYVNCNSDSEINLLTEFKVYLSDSSYFKTIKAHLVNKNRIERSNDSLSCNNQSDLCVTRLTYKGKTSLPYSKNPYRVVYQQKSNISGIQNIKGSEKTSLVLIQDIQPINDVGFKNRGPIFEQFPQLQFCASENLKLNLSAVDQDEDELQYELYTPLTSKSKNNSKKKNTFLIEPIQWNSFYNKKNPFGIKSKTNLNSNNGELYVNAHSDGTFILGVRIKEWRNGVLIGQSTREFLFNVNYSSFIEIAPMANVFYDESFENNENTVENEDQTEENEELDSEILKPEDLIVQSAEEFEQEVWQNTNYINRFKDTNKYEEPIENQQLSSEQIQNNEEKMVDVIPYYELGNQRKPFKNNDWWIRKPNYTCGYVSGVIYINIKVGQDGRVIKAWIDEKKTNSTNDCMRKKAVKYAKKSRFAIDPDAPKIDVGWIRYTFVSQ